MILENLYFRNSENFRRPPEYWELRAQIRPYEEQIRKAFGFSFLDEYVKLYGRLADLAEEQRFRDGVQFTLRFLLEGLLQNPHL